MPLPRYRDILPDPEGLARLAERPEPTTFRVRTGRIAPDALVRRLEARGFEIEPTRVPGPVYRVLGGPAPVGDTVEHWLGLLYVQQAVTTLAAPALDPRPGDAVLDMCAAPGGKTTHLADLMDDRGCLVAADASEKRLPALMSNVYRCAHTGVLAVASDGRALGGRALFDRVLVDAPCSGEGTLRKKRGGPRPQDPAFLRRIARTQEALLRRALELVRPGGVVLYCTCTFNPDENEAVVSRVLADGGVEVEPIPFDGPHEPGLAAFEGTSYDPALGEAWRLYPGHYDSGGFFMARLRKDGAAPAPGPAGPGWTGVPAAFPDEAAAREEARARIEAGLDGLRERWGVEPGDLVPGGAEPGWLVRGGSIWMHTVGGWPEGLWPDGDEGPRLQAVGLRALKDDPRTGERPTSDLLVAADGALGEARLLDVDRGALEGLLRREPLEGREVPDGFVALRFRGRVLGRAHARDGRVRSEIPKAHARRLLEALEREGVSG